MTTTVAEVTSHHRGRGMAGFSNIADYFHVSTKANLVVLWAGGIVGHYIGSLPLTSYYLNHLLNCTSLVQRYVEAAIL